MTEPNPVEGEQSREAKYKKLLALARSSLESNQATLAMKDKQISQLMMALEEEKQVNTLLKQKSKGRTEQDDPINIPRSILRRVDVDDKIWVLIEYEGQPNAWQLFDNENELKDFVQRVPGAPIPIPNRCLTEEESVAIVSLIAFFYVFINSPNVFHYLNVILGIRG
jgi:hypothetical protein